jgi:hypothetical protein
MNQQPNAACIESDLHNILVEALCYKPEGCGLESVTLSSRKCGILNISQVKRKVKTMLIMFLASRELFTKKSSWQAKQSVPHTAVTYYGN